MNRVDNLLTTIRKTIVNIILGILIIILLPIGLLLVLYEYLEDYLVRDNVTMVCLILALPIAITQFIWFREILNIIVVLWTVLFTGL